jgi:nitrate reductase NapD
LQNVRNGSDCGKEGTDRAAAFGTTASTRLYHVAGILVYAAPALEHQVCSGIEALPRAMVHAHAAGQIVATLEGPVSGELIAALETIQRLPGVLTALLVSEHSEPIEGIDEEIELDRSHDKA